MAEISWTRKYRPQKLSEYVGNDNVKNNISRLISIDRLPQTMIFSGERGTGKTSLARLVGKSLLCLRPNESEPCETCRSCELFNTVYFTTGETPRELSINEIDITSMNRREDATVIIDQMRARSLGGGKRIYILDEIQRATKEAQSSFLKIAEEPPQDVYIILCTTDPEDLLVPLRSRFHNFIIRRPDSTSLTRRIEYICEQEGVNYQTRAIRLLVDTMRNNPRETINKAELLGMVGNITQQVIEDDMSIISSDTYRKFISASREGNISYVSQIVESFQQTGDKSVQEFITGFGQYVSELMKLRNGVNVDKYSASELSANRQEISHFTDIQIVKMLSVINKYTKTNNEEPYLLLSLGADLILALEIVHEPQTQHMEEIEVAEEYSKVTRKVIESKPPKEPEKVEAEDLMEIFGTSIKKVNL